MQAKWRIRRSSFSTTMADGTSGRVTFIRAKRHAYEYHAETLWRIRPTQRELAEITRSPEDLARWWPASFLEATKTQHTGDFVPGLEACCHMKGWLPHTMVFWGRIEDVVLGEKFSVQLWGDLEGRMDCNVNQEGDYCRIRFELRVRVSKPIVRRLSFVLKPLFYSNHVWLMMRGMRSVKQELARRNNEIPLDTRGPAIS